MPRNTIVSLVSLAVMFGATANASSQEPRPLPAGVPQLPAPQVLQAVPGAPVATPVMIRPISINEFLASFQPVPGNYEVVFVHPKTGCPVKVCFCLPVGCPKKVRYCCNELKFDYGRRDVEIRFKRDGRVVVDYD